MDKTISKPVSAAGTLQQHPRFARLHVCQDCGTTYPDLMFWNRGADEMQRGIRCNSHTITVCPWCRPDSKPWFAGRGV